MNRLFDADNKLNRFLAKVFDCGILSVLWIVCSIPVFTMGAATIAMYTVTLKMVKNEEGAIVRSFFKAFRECAVLQCSPSNCAVFETTMVSRFGRGRPISS